MWKYNNCGREKAFRINLKVDIENAIYKKKFSTNIIIGFNYKEDICKPQDI